MLKVRTGSAGGAPTAAAYHMAERRAAYYEVVTVRSDLDPALADRLGIDAARPLEQAELANLLAGLQTSGAPTGKQIQKPIKALTEVFGLADDRLPTAEEIERVIASDDPAKRRFLAAYGLVGGGDLTPDQMSHLRDGKTVHGAYLDTSAVMSDLTATKEPTTFAEGVFSASKSVSLSWALGTETQRRMIQTAHHDAVEVALRHLEKTIGQSRIGKAGSKGTEAGKVAWVLAEHHTSRPVEGIADPQLHSHALIMNVSMGETTGKLRSMDLRIDDGTIKETGLIYQAALAGRLRAEGVSVSMDPENGTAHVNDVSRQVERAFSRRHAAIEKTARAEADAGGQDWQTLTDDQRNALLARAVIATRKGKLPEQGDDFDRWKQEAAELGYKHNLHIGKPMGLAPDAERHRVAYEASLPFLEKALHGRAKLDASIAREAAAMGLVEAGISDNPAADIKRVMSMYRTHGVMQDGRMTAIAFGHEPGVRGKKRWSMTTEMHIDQERQVIGLARAASVDLSGAVSHDALERASQDYLANNTKIKADDPQWIAQREVIEQLGTGGRLGVAIGVAGAGKTTLTAPIVSAMRDDGREVYGISRGWKQATALRESGIDKQHVAATSVFISRVNKSKITLDDKSVVIIDELSQVSRGDMLQLLKLQNQHGFTVYAIGDHKQIGAIESPVMDLLVGALGDKVPEILTSVRQRTAREREIAGLFRSGHASEAIHMKLADGTAELVQGGRPATVRAIADKWYKLRQAGTEPTIGVVSNADAHEISTAIRKRLQDAGDIGPDIYHLPVLRDREVENLPLAVGDKVRLFRRVADFGSNGDVVEITRLSQDGMTARNATGQVANIGWESLRGKGDAAPRLALGHATTVDAAQGTTSAHHIDAILSGSGAHAGGRGYVNESRHTETTWLVVNAEAERQAMNARKAYGDRKHIGNDQIWQNVAGNMSRETAKVNAMDFVASVELTHGTIKPLDRPRQSQAVRDQARQVHRPAQGQQREQQRQAEREAQRQRPSRGIER